MSLEGRIVACFLRDHPREAARVLERMPAAEAAAALQEAEPRELAAVMGALVPSIASSHLERMEPARAAELVAVMDSDRAADLLRRLELSRRSSVLAGLPRERRGPIERLLRFPPGTAGALMQPEFVAFHESRTAEDALNELKERGTDLRYYIYVVDDELTLQGVLSVREVVASPSTARLEEVMRRPVETLSARAERTAILKHPGWKRYPALPVVDESARLVGAFPYRTFQQLHGAPDDSADPGALGLALALGELFWWGASSLFRGLERTQDGDWTS